MATDLSFLKRVKDTVYFDSYRMEIFIPKDYFDNKVAEYYGRKISTIGMFVYRVFKDEKSYKEGKSRNFQLTIPEAIFIEFSEKESIKMKTKKDSDEESYEVFILEKGNVFIENVQLTQFFKNTEDIIKLHHNARLPEMLEYNKILDLYIDSMNNNNASLKMPLVLIEMIISELARYKRNLDIPFRKAIGSNNSSITERDYIQMSIKNLAMRNSTFTAITSEDINQALISSINKTENNGIEKDTPIEKVIKY